FYRRRHTHLILLHQQLVQVSFGIDIKELIEQRTIVDSLERFAHYVVGTSLELFPEFSSQQLILHGPREYGEVVEVDAFDIWRERQKSPRQLLANWRGVG